MKSLLCSNRISPICLFTYITKKIANIIHTRYASKKGYDKNFKKQESIIFNRCYELSIHRERK